MKIYIISDIHLVTPGAVSKGLDTAERLQWALDDLAGPHADSDLCILLGDLADHGEEAAYRELRARLAEVTVPVAMTIGNHDSREMFRKVFPEAPDDGGGFVQSVHDTPLGRLILLDTAEHGFASGILCERRLAWLAARLDEARGRPVLLFLHHPPFELGMKVDGIGLRQQGELGALLAGHGDVRQIIAGHTHRVCSGVWRGIPFTNLGASTYNVGVHLSGLPGHGKRYGGPVMTGVMLIGADQVVVHAQDVSPFQAPLPAQLFPESRIEEIIARGGKLAAE